jgi:hypothetical protein
MYEFLNDSIDEIIVRQLKCCFKFKFFVSLLLYTLNFVIMKEKVCVYLYLLQITVKRYDTRKLD